MERGQSELLGLIMLIGFVLVSAATVAVVGYAAVGSVQDQSETERGIGEIRAVSQDITDTVYAEGATTTDVESGYEVDEGATVRLEVDGTEMASYETGGFARDGLVYEGGLVVDADGQVVTGPELTLDPGTTTFQVPVIDHEETPRFHGEIRHDHTETPDLAADERVTITIQSSYYEQWYDQFADANAVVTKDDATETVVIAYDVRDRGPRPIANALTIGMAEGSTFDLNEMPDTHLESYDEGTFDRHDAVLATTVDGGNLGGGSGELSIQGAMRSEGDISDLEDHTQTEITGPVESFADVTPPTPTDELLVSPAEARNVSEATAYEPGDGDLEGGVYYTDGDLTLADAVNVTDETILVVDGDLALEAARIEAHAALDVHVHGSLELADDAMIATGAPYRGDQVSVFVADDVGIDGEQDATDPTGPAVTGLIYATDATVDHEGAFTVYGAMVVDDYELSDGQQANPHHNDFTLHFDERLEGASPYATSSVEGSVLTEFFEAYDGEVHEGDYEDEGDIDDDLLVTGQAEVRASLIEGDLYVEDGAAIDSHGGGGDLYVMDGLEIDGGTVDGDVWVDGATTVADEANIDGDLHVDGDVDIGSGTVGNVYVVGDLTIDGDPNVNGEIHVIGDLIVDGEPVGDDVYVDGDVIVSGHLNEGLDAAGDVTCDGGSIDGDLAVGGDYVGDCDPATVGDDPVPPRIPDALLSGPELLEMPTYEMVTHYFDLRFAQVDLE